MGLVVDFLEALQGNVRVYFGGGEILVTQHLLDSLQVAAMVQKMGGKRMPDGMRRDGPCKTCHARASCDYKRDPRIAQPLVF